MEPRVRDALWEWLAGLIVGAWPLGAHLLSHFSSKPARADENGWSIDFLFLILSTSGTSAISVVNRLVSGELQGHRIGKSLSVLIAMTVLIVIAASAAYGAISVGTPSEYIGYEVAGLLVFSVVVSVYLEMTLAVVRPSQT